VPEPESKSIPQVASELIDLLKTYAKQETVDPLKRVGHFMKLGMPGALLATLGAVLLLMSLLRALQTETGSTFTGNWSWVPYVFTLLAGVAIAGIAAMLITRKRRKEVS
jgi:hypothetical protein